jgi:AcrR family transcriptional regulator
MVKKVGMRISELEKRSGVPRTTIHFYQRHGLLPEPVKTGRTMAYYDQRHLQRLREIEEIKKAGRVPLSFLKERIAALDSGSDRTAAGSGASIRERVRTNKAKDNKRQEIVKSAIKVFSQKGYHQTKVQDITKSIGISTGTFYIYFNNKRDLFVEVIDEIFRTIVGEAALELREEEDPQQRLVIRGEVFYRNYSKYNEILHQLRAEMASEDRWPQARVRQAYLELTRPVIREIQEAIDKGQTRKIDPDLLAYALTGIIEIMSLRLKLDDKYTFKQVQEFMIDFVNFGMALAPSPDIKSKDAWGA